MSESADAAWESTRDWLRMLYWWDALIHAWRGIGMITCLMHDDGETE